MDDVSQLPDETINWLIQNRFLVVKGINETVQLFDEMLKSCINQKKSFFRILTTTGCNADCTYCFEREFPRKIMDEETANSVADFITDKSKQYKTIGLGWFGGEPLLNKEVISLIIYKLKNQNSDKNIYSTITTNGSLFDSTIIEAAKEWNVTNIQITLDGTEKRHDMIKRYKSKKYGFKQTIDNIKILVKSGFKITIRINYSEQDIIDTLKLIDYVYCELKNTVKVYCSPLFIMGSVEELEISSAIESIILKKMIDYSYINPEIILKRRKITCGLASYSDYMVIDPNGIIYKCCEAMVRPDLSKIGDIRGGELDESIIERWKQPTVDSNCLKCECLPLCLGGCKCTRLGISSMKCFRYKTQIKNIIQYISEQTGVR
jgi:uncharacterized protein